MTMDSPINPIFLKKHNNALMEYLRKEIQQRHARYDKLEDRFKANNLGSMRSMNVQLFVDLWDVFKLIEETEILEWLYKQFLELEKESKK